MSTTATLPPWRVSHEPTDEDRANFETDKRVAGMLKRKREDDAEIEAFERMLVVKKISDADPEWALHCMTEPDRNGKRTIIKIPMGGKTPPPHLKALIAQHPLLITSVSWNSLGIDARMEICTSSDLAPDLVLATDIHAVLPDASQNYLEEWQRLINDGTVWNVAGHVGKQARALIEGGFCLEAPETTKGTWLDGVNRHDVPPGRPGSAAFVRAMMGDAYLAWIEGVR